MEEELNKKNKTSIINKLFTGMFVNIVKCTECNNISESYEPFPGISLSIYYSYSIDDCFNNFFSPDKLCG